MAIPLLLSVIYIAVRIKGLIPQKIFLLDYFICFLTLVAIYLSSLEGKKNIAFQKQERYGVVFSKPSLLHLINSGKITLSLLFDLRTTVFYLK